MLYLLDKLLYLSSSQPSLQAPPIMRVVLVEATFLHMSYFLLSCILTLLCNQTQIAIKPENTENFDYAPNIVPSNVRGIESKLNM